MQKVVPHVILLRFIEEAPIGMGRALLSQCLRGEDTLKIARLKLHLLPHYGALPLYDKTDVYRLVDLLVNKRFIAYKPLEQNKFIKVLRLTDKGKKELINPTHDIRPGNRLDRHFKSITKVTERDRTLFKRFGKTLAGLSDEQKKAVLCDARYILTIAGAGSGKTRVLTKRIWFLSKFKGCKQEKILAITFTRKARDVMRSRINKMLLTNSVQIHTFNSFCENILQRDADFIYNKRFKVMSYTHKVKLILGLLQEHGITVDEIIKLYYCNRRQSEEKKTLFFGLVNDIFSVLDYQRNNYISDEDLLTYFDEDDACARIVRQILMNIKHYKAKLGFRDFTDQIMHVIEHFKSGGHIPVYDHILIDEFQDINSLQFELIALLKPANLFAVGDPRQSIYGWRGARIDFILDFEEHFQGATVLQLTKNYRSADHIVQVCNKIISPMKLPDLHANGKKGKAVILIKHPGEDSEMTFVAQSILSQQCERRNIFILARTNKQIEKIALKLRQAGIKFLKRTIEEKKEKREPAENEVTLSTIHAIKGLEAEIVYLIGANTIYHPCKASEHPVLEDLKIHDTYDKYAEEHRLFYVAASRAKEKLIINYTGNLTNYMNSEALKLVKGGHIVSSEIKQQKSGHSRLFQTLRIWRNETAQMMRVPPYRIFNDRTLQELCTYRPTSKEELYEINGFGPYKIKKYGNEVVAIVTEHM